jgi:hypothetical protein
MALVVTTAGQLDLAKYYVNLSAPQDLVLHLYTNNYMPGQSSALGSFVEASGGGYDSIILSGSDWTISSGEQVEAVCKQQVFTCDGSAQGQSCYGYFVTRSASGTIAHAERFPNGPYSFANDGDQIKITPKIEFASK